MPSLTHIVSGWHNFIKGSPLVQERMKRRLAVCNQCPNKEQVDRVTGFLVKLVDNDKKNLFRCSLCKCPLASLTASPLQGCKEKRWT